VVYRPFTSPLRLRIFAVYLAELFMYRMYEVDGVCRNANMALGVKVIARRRRST
jgi:hypothetical protein